MLVAGILLHRVQELPGGLLQPVPGEVIEGGYVLLPQRHGQGVDHDLVGVRGPEVREVAVGGEGLDLTPPLAMCDTSTVQSSLVVRSYIVSLSESAGARGDARHVQGMELEHHRCMGQ